MTCDFFLTAAQYESVKPGDLVCVRYGADLRYFIRHDDGRGDLVAFIGRQGQLTGYAYGPETSDPWDVLMSRQRGTLHVIKHNLPRSGSATVAPRAICLT